MSANPVIFITIPYSQLKKGVTLFDLQGVGVNILLDSTDIDVLLLQDFFAAHRCPYIYSLSGKLFAASGLDVFFSRFYTALALSNAFCEANCRIPIITNTADIQLSEIASLRAYFISQGEENVDLVICPSTNVHHQRYISLLSDISALEELNEGQLEEYMDRETRQIILCLKGSVAEEVNRVQKVVENNRYVKLLLRMIAVQVQADNKLRQEDVWQKRAKLYLSFVSLGKEIGAMEYYDIKQWYQDEYEVLPLWYKRVGHVIKAITGKRSFKSLFTD